MKKPRISLCMIVKNEEHNLPRCLDSVQGQVDEIVVVDTGSTDRTVEVASRYGAKMVTFAWNGDFSAARNVSLDHASGDWVLWLDADEELLEGTGGMTLPELAASTDVDAYLVPIQNMKADGSFTAHFAVRFFRKLEGIRFEGKAHESVGDWLLRQNARIAQSPVPIRHWGYAVSDGELQRKLDRNLELLMAQLKQTPNSSYVHYYIGMTLIGKKDFEGSFRHLQKAHELGPETPNMECLVANMIAHHHLHRCQYDEAEKWARRSLAVTTQQHTGRLFLGIALYNQKKFAEALPLLQGAYQFQRQPLMRRRSDISLEHAHGEKELLWAVARSAYEVGRYPLAYQFLERLSRSYSPDGTVALLQGLCALAMESYRSATCHFQQAGALGASWAVLGAPWVQALLRLDRADEALRVLEDAGASFFHNEKAGSIFTTLVERCFESQRIGALSKVLERIVRNGPTHPLVLDALAVCRIKAGDYARAAEALEALLELDPGNPEVRRRLAAVWYGLGDRERAAHLLRHGRSREAVGAMW
ncbi:Glycosyltransferase involved in cell wall bisynthesis [Desulfacinum hydrothermale DSM 13146]|uniref:Glycosyltransferase involved in cell wall bisynthesis n=1 Tax=Desulfacinum hydrothermale DSM 13146 TaxID=1121390 RepID=A0A1W1XEV7_9BACT|nr:TPR domain-containing glycosyltransferase [Desulfacinum hydrothermale]SMC22440.1 Glycosyltransferase involved in cell wall bisynthesis [Desulfacinum hydrothermale DSM 13146]